MVTIYCYCIPLTISAINLLWFSSSNRPRIGEVLASIAFQLCHLRSAFHTVLRQQSILIGQVPKSGVTAEQEN